MRQTISGLVAAIAVVTVTAVPAMACGGGLFQSSCSPCGQVYVEPCAQVYAPPVYSGCNTGCGGWGYERLADPEQQYYAAPVHHQYYYVNQGPTYTGPGDFAPVPTYRESGWSGYSHHAYRYGHATPRYEGYGYRPHRMHSYRYGYAPRTAYAPRYSLPPRGYYAPRHSMRYGMPMGMPHAYGRREMHEHMMRRYN
jgi:hypothetical protein